MTDFHYIWFEHMRNFKFPTLGNNNMADAQTCEVGATVAPRNTGSLNYVW